MLLIRVLSADIFLSLKSIQMHLTDAKLFNINDNSVPITFELGQELTYFEIVDNFQDTMLSENIGMY